MSAYGNEPYKADESVLNSSDECFVVASKIFFNGDYRELHCVCALQYKLLANGFII